MKVAFDYKFKGKGRIKTVVNKKARGRKNKSKLDVIHGVIRGSDGEWIMDADVTPEEAVYIANAFLCAYTMYKEQKKDE